MRTVDPQVFRMLRSLSDLLGKHLELGEETVESPGVVVASEGAGGRQVSIRTSDGAPFDSRERAVICEVADLVRRSVDCHSEQDMIGQRLQRLERENLELALRNRTLTDLSSKDALTGLYTRWFVFEKMEAELNRSVRHGNDLSILMIDLDHFKSVNDTFGHPVGDQVLQAVGVVLRESCRVYDIPGRYGGEEFCLVLPETKVDKTMVVAERIRNRLESTPFTSGGQSIRVTTSIGVAGLESLPADDLLGASSLIERADRALYQAKHRGRNRIEVWNASATGH